MVQLNGFDPDNQPTSICKHGNVLKYVRQIKGAGLCSPPSLCLCPKFEQPHNLKPYLLFWACESDIM